MTHSITLSTRTLVIYCSQYHFPRTNRPRVTGTTHIKVNQKSRVGEELATQNHQRKELFVVLIANYRPHKTYENYNWYLRNKNKTTKKKKPTQLASEVQESVFIINTAMMSDEAPFRA